MSETLCCKRAHLQYLLSLLIAEIILKIDVLQHAISILKALQIFDAPGMHDMPNESLETAKSAPVPFWEYYKKAMIEHAVELSLYKQLLYFKALRIAILDYTGFSIRLSSLFSKPHITVYFVEDPYESVMHIASQYDLIYFMTFNDQYIESEMESIRIIIDKGLVMRGRVDVSKLRIIAYL